MTAKRTNTNKGAEIMKQYVVQTSNMNTRNWETVAAFDTRKEAEKCAKRLAPTYARIVEIGCYVR